MSRISGIRNQSSMFDVLTTQPEHKAIRLSEEEDLCERWKMEDGCSQDRSCRNEKTKHR